MLFDRKRRFNPYLAASPADVLGIIAIVCAEFLDNTFELAIAHPASVVGVAHVRQYVFLTAFEGAGATVNRVTSPASSCASSSTLPYGMRRGSPL